MPKPAKIKKTGNFITRNPIASLTVLIGLALVIWLLPYQRGVFEEGVNYQYSMGGSTQANEDEIIKEKALCEAMGMQFLYKPPKACTEKGERVCTIVQSELSNPNDGIWNISCSFKTRYDLFAGMVLLGVLALYFFDKLKNKN